MYCITITKFIYQLQHPSILQAWEFIPIIFKSPLLFLFVHRFFTYWAQLDHLSRTFYFQYSNRWYIRSHSVCVYYLYTLKKACVDNVPQEVQESGWTCAVHLYCSSRRDDVLRLGTSSEGIKISGEVSHQRQSLILRMTSIWQTVCDTNSRHHFE